MPRIATYGEAAAVVPGLAVKFVFSVKVDLQFFKPMLSLRSTFVSPLSVVTSKMTGLSVCSAPLGLPKFSRRLFSASV
jgi:hypothetical protein